MLLLVVTSCFDTMSRWALQQMHQPYKVGLLKCRCQTLDSGADGYVRAEGCGTMMLQNADEFHKSAQDGQAVLAYMHATAVNQDGRSSSLTAPNGPSQQGVIRQALQASALEPEHMHALQLHGTGTITLLMMSRCHTTTMCLCTDAAVTMLEAKFEYVVVSAAGTV